jgi:hypothetical protein
MRIRFPRRSLTLLIAVAVGVAALGGTAFASHRASPRPEHRTPKIAAEWAEAWNGTDPQALANLFTTDATYTDLALNVTSVGHSGIAAWKLGTDNLIADVHITVQEAFRSDDHIAIETIYAGHIHGAPSSFAVPTTTILELKGHLITSDRDYYNLATLLAQSGLPPTWTPPAS